MLDPTSLVVAVISAASTVTAAVVASQANRNARAARAVGDSNSDKLDVIANHTDPRQAKLIEKAVQKVAQEHPELIREALADEFVRTVLEAILDGNLEPRRRRSDPS